MKRLALSLLLGLLAVPMAGQASRDFDGSNDTVTCGDINALDGLSNITAFAWVNLDDLDAEFSGPINKRDSWLLRKTDTEAPDFTIQGNGSATGTASTIVPGAPACLVGTFDASLGSARIKVFLNGVQVGSSNGAGTAAPSTTFAVTIGSRVSDRFWDGQIAHAGVEARTWSEAEIQDYCAGNLAVAQRAAGGTGGYLPLWDNGATPTTYIGQGLFAGVCSATNHPAVSTAGPNVFIPGGN